MHNTHNYHKCKFTTTSFYCFINGKIKKEPKKISLDINVAKNGHSVFFRGKQQILQQMVNSAAWHENPHAAEYCWHWQCLQSMQLFDFCAFLFQQNKGTGILHSQEYIIVEPTVDCIVY